MYRLLQRSRTPSRVLLSLLALLEIAPIRADGVMSRKEARRAMKESKGELTSSRSLEDRAKKLVAEAPPLKPADLLPAFDLPPEVTTPPATSIPSESKSDNNTQAPAPSSAGTTTLPEIDLNTKKNPLFLKNLPEEQTKAPTETANPMRVEPAVPVAAPAQTPEEAPAPIQTIPQAPAVQTAPVAPIQQAPAQTPQLVPMQKRPEQNSVFEEKGPTAASNTATGPEKYLVNLNNVSIGEYIRFISRISGKNFVYDANDLNFNVTIISEELTTIDEIMAALMNELRIHGLSLIEQGNNLIIHNNPNVNSPSNIVPRDGDDKIPAGAQIVTRVFRLNSFDATKAKAVLTPLLSAQAIIEPLPDTGHLILTDFAYNIEKVGQLLATLDSPSSGMQVAQYRGKNLYVDSLAALAQRIIVPLTEEGKKITFVPFRETNTLFIISTPGLIERALTILKEIDQGVMSSGTGGNRLGPNGELLGPDGRPLFGPNGELLGPDGKPLLGRDGRPVFGNKLGSAGALSGVAGALSPEGLPLGHLLSTDFDIYKLQYRKGDQIQQALQSIATSLLDTETRAQATNVNANPTSPEAPSTLSLVSNLANSSQSELASAISSVQWLETTNMLVFTGTRAANAKLKSLIAELDIPNEQVLIELLLLDTTITDSLSYGVDWGTKFGGPNTAGAQGFNSLGTPLPGVLNQIPTGGLLNAATLAQATGFSLGVIGQNIIHCGNAYGSIGALVRALHTRADSHVVLNQKIVVEDNQPAEIFVGLNVPFKTQSVANDFGTILTNNFEYRDIGATLKVTPFINQNGLITLQLEQELSTLIASDVNVFSNSTFQNALGSGPTTRKSNTKTTIFVPNGFFVILSGNIQDEDDRTRDEVPCLGGIPFIGALFSNKNNSANNRALMIFIRPTLISTKEEIHYQTKRQQDIFDEKTQLKNMWDWEITEAFDFLNIREGECR